MKTLQSKKKSFVESLVNTLIGLLTTLLLSPLVYWICDVEITYPKMTWVTIIFTFVSILRNYIIRRFFNKLK